MLLLLLVFFELYDCLCIITINKFESWSVFINYCNQTKWQTFILKKAYLSLFCNDIYSKTGRDRTKTCGTIRRSLVNPGRDRELPIGVHPSINRFSEYLGHQLIILLTAFGITYHNNPAVYYKMISKNTPKSAIYWRKRLFHLKMFALRNSPVRHSLYISRLINNQAPSYRSEWSAFIIGNYKTLEKLLSPFHKISFHSNRRRASARSPIRQLIACDYDE